MTTQILILGFLAAASLPQKSAASDWRPVVQADNYEMFIDIESIVRKDSKAKTWVKLIYKNPVDVETSSGKLPSLSAISLTSFHCTERAYLNLQTTTYKDRESTIVIHEQRRTDFRSDYFNVQPDSVGEDMYNFVCNPSQVGIPAFPAKAQPEFQASPSKDATSISGSFSLAHWVLSFLVAANAATIVHIAVSNETTRLRKAGWVAGCLLVPFIPYLVWLFTRKNKPS